MTLKKKLEKLKKIDDQSGETDWVAYKEAWRKSVSDLQNLIQYKWLYEYEGKSLMVFDIIPVKRIDPYIGEYITQILEITLTNGKSLLMEPVSSITSEYEGRLDFYMRGNIYKKVSVLRKITKGKDEWIVAKSYDPKDHFKFNKQQLEKIIDEWLQ